MLHLAIFVLRLLFPHKPKPPEVPVSVPTIPTCVIPRCEKDASQDVSLSDGYVICWHHQEQLRAKLRTIETYMGIIDARPKKGGLGVRSAPGFGSKPPVDLNVIVMTDPRSSGGSNGPDDDENPLLSVPAVLMGWVTLFSVGCQNWREALVTLLTNVDWYARQDFAGDFAEEISKLYGQLRSVVRDDPWPTVGPCIQPKCLGQVHRVDVPHTDEDQAARGVTEQRVRCGQCRHDYLSAFEWLEISRQGDLAKDKAAA